MELTDSHTYDPHTPIAAHTLWPPIAPHNPHPIGYPVPGTYRVVKH